LKKECRGQKRELAVGSWKNGKNGNWQLAVGKRGQRFRTQNAVGLVTLSSACPEEPKGRRELAKKKKTEPFFPPQLLHFSTLVEAAVPDVP
jgi:hypothetical protein